MAAQTTGSALLPSATDVISNSSPDPTFNAEEFSSPIITLRIEPERTVLTAHKAILTKADIFAKCLAEGRFEEGSKNEIDFPEDNPGDFLAALRYLYTGQVEQLDPRNWAQSTYDMPQLIRLYANADKYCIEGMCQQVLNLVRYDYPARRLTWAHLNAVKATGLQGSRMWQLIRESAHDCARIYSNLEKIMDDGLRADSEAAVDLLDELAKRIPHDWSCSKCQGNRGEGYKGYENGW